MYSVAGCLLDEIESLTRMQDPLCALLGSCVHEGRINKFKEGRKMSGGKLPVKGRDKYWRECICVGRQGMEGAEGEWQYGQLEISCDHPLEEVPVMSQVVTC